MNGEIFIPIAAFLLFWVGPILLMAAIYVSLRRSSARREVFTLHLRACVRLQLPLDKALAQSEGAPAEIGAMMRKTSRQLEGGVPLGVALAGQWACIPSWYTRMVQIGERYGNLADVLDRVVEADSRAEELRVRLFERILYPLFLCSFLISILSALIIWIIPSFVDMFKDMGVELPLSTKILFAGSAFFTYMPVVGIAIWALLIAAVLILPFPWGRNLEQRFWPLFRLRYQLLRFVPFLGKYHVRAACGRWATTVSMLLDAGCPLPDAVEEASRVESDPRFRKTAGRWAELVRGGERLGDVIADTTFVPRSFVWQVKTAEGGRHFPDVLRQVGENEVVRVQMQVGRLVRAITPFLVLVIGSVVGFVCTSIFACLAKLTYTALE
jgi:type II secretory pathway component PulF